ncbi:hypothetical protein [Niveispirillum sp.]|uniref:hypothetical protein n=1 Tax=Niveispirillum sp. TaxID=1917217 RepID=UPI001B559361|nr:hypothetical protein [Niveispirillum sp.]MBP7339940.1 hypothetical protein [Niveispirillum sp.]
MDPLSTDTLAGAGLALAIAGAIAGVRWLVTGKAREIDGLPALVQSLRLDLVRITARLDRAEADIANDRAGRRAFGAVEILVSKINSDIGHLSADLQKLSDRHERGNQDIWTAIDRLRETRETV